MCPPAALLRPRSLAGSLIAVTALRQNPAYDGWLPGTRGGAAVDASLNRPCGAGDAPRAAAPLEDEDQAYLFGPNSRCTFTCACEANPSTNRGSYFHLRTASTADLSNMPDGADWMTETS